jgi:sugar-specific transcriptional regulator TrmB
MSYSKLVNTLLRCGLNDTESIIVADLLNRGDSTAGAIAIRTGIKRATIYSALAQLEERGLLRRARERAVTRFALVQHKNIIQEIRALWAKRISSIDVATSNLEEILRGYSEMQSQHIAGYEITSFESRRKTEEFFLQTLSLGHYDSVFDISTFSDKRWRALMLELLKSTAIAKPPIREMIVASSDYSWYTSKIRNPNHAVKLVKSKGELDSDFTVTKDSVILNSYKEGVEVSIQIRHQGYHATMSRVFEALWGSVSIL